MGSWAPLAQGEPEALDMDRGPVTLPIIVPPAAAVPFRFLWFRPRLIEEASCDCD